MQDFTNHQITLFRGHLNPFVTAYDGDDGNDPVPPAEPVTPPVTPPIATPATPDKKFVQKDVDRIVQDRLARAQETHGVQVDKLVAELEGLKTKATMTDGEREALGSRIEELRSEHLSAAQKATKTIKELEAKFTKVEAEKTNVQKEWRDRYDSFRIDRELMDAATFSNALTPMQLVKMLIPDTKVVEQLTDAGEPTGNYDVKTAITIFEGEGDKKTPVAIELSPRDAIAKLREMPNIWGNQFAADAADGVGGNQSVWAPRVPKPDATEMPDDFEEYKAWRANNPKEAGLSK